MTLLPRDMQNVLLRFHGGEDPLTDGENDAYDMFLTEVIEHSSSIVIERMAAIAEDLAEKQILAAADELYKNNAWRSALCMYGYIEADSQAVNGEFWYRTGICFFRLGEKESSLDCFNNAKNLSCEQGDIDTYVAWCGGKAN